VLKAEAERPKASDISAKVKAASSTFVNLQSGTEHYGLATLACPHEVRRDRATAGDRRQNGVVEEPPDDEGLRRREG